MTEKFASRIKADQVDSDDGSALRANERKMAIDRYLQETAQQQIEHDLKISELNLSKIIRIFSSSIIAGIIVILWVIVLWKIYHEQDFLGTGNNIWIFESLIIFTSITFALSNNLLPASLKNLKINLNMPNKKPIKNGEE